MSQIRFAAVALFLLAMCSVLAGCKNSERTWFREVRSPDNRFIVTAETLQFGGWGTSAPPETYVDLNWASGSQKPALILSFNGASSSPEGMKVDIHWITSNHIEIVYKDNPNITFQAIRWNDVDISAHAE